MENTHTENQTHNYGPYIVVWLALVALTAATVTFAGLNLSGLTVITALTIASIKSGLVVNYFMHIKSESVIFKVFIGICILIFIVMIVLTFFDLTFRPEVK